MSEEKKPLSWQKEELPGMYSKLEAILYQTAWVLREELKKQKRQAEKIKTIFEQEMGNHKK